MLNSASQISDSIRNARPATLVLIVLFVAAPLNSVIATQKISLVKQNGIPQSTAPTIERSSADPSATNDVGHGTNPTSIEEKSVAEEVPTSSSTECQESLVPFADSAEQARRLCTKMQSLSDCRSVKGRVIAHYDEQGSVDASERASGLAAEVASEVVVRKSQKSLVARSQPRILVFGLIHGDEPLAAKLAVQWVQRLTEISPRNIWRVVPVLNPDGYELKTRMNANRVDLNRNFPTRDWSEAAQQFWKGSQKSDPRRFPGNDPASEPETKCVMKHIEKFDPDLIVSIHTPYGVLDFDGPKVAFPKYSDLPWKGLGNFPGSLGRYMWKDKGIPVLTIEMKTKMIDAAEIQDSVGLLMQTLLKTQASGKRTGSRN